MHFKDNIQSCATSTFSRDTTTGQRKVTHTSRPATTTENEHSDTTEKLVRVVLVDEQPLFRRGVRAALERAGNYVIVGEMINMTDVLEKTRTDTPDVAFIDTELIATDPFFLVQQMHLLAPHLAFIMLAQSEDESYLLPSINVGASAYLLRNVSSKELIATLAAVRRGEYPIQKKVFSDPQLSRVVFHSIEKVTTSLVVVPQDDHNPMPLSQRELEILSSISQGRTNKAVAESLQISDQTVKNHITSILKKLSVADRTAAVMCALRHGWITLDDWEQGTEK